MGLGMGMQWVIECGVVWSTLQQFPRLSPAPNFTANMPPPLPYLRSAFSKFFGRRCLNFLGVVEGVLEQ